MVMVWQWLVFVVFQMCVTLLEKTELFAPVHGHSSLTALQINMVRALLYCSLSSQKPDPGDTGLD